MSKKYSWGSKTNKHVYRYLICDKSMGLMWVYKNVKYVIYPMPYSQIRLKQLVALHVKIIAKILLGKEHVVIAS